MSNKKKQVHFNWRRFWVRCNEQLRRLAAIVISVLVFLSDVLRVIDQLLI
jgi:hypothetical protein